MSRTATESGGDGGAGPEFAFLTNHGKTLLLIAHDPQTRIRDIAQRLKITERATQRIVAELAKSGYVERERDGRRNRYTIRADAPLGLPLERDSDIAALLALLHPREHDAGTSHEAHSNPSPPARDSVAATRAHDH